MKLRLDKLLVERGLAASRERAQALILAGSVLVDDQKLEKAGAQVAPDATIRLLGEDLKYVSRGGLKLERALEHWQIEVEGTVCLDVGASTGGFTDCLAIGEDVGLVVMDVSFISATLVLPAVVHAAFPAPAEKREGRQIVVLVKPQFEAGREHVGKGGIVRDEAAQLGAVERVKQALLNLGCLNTAAIESPILGAEGNREFLLHGVF